MMAVMMVMAVPVERTFRTAEQKPRLFAGKPFVNALTGKKGVADSGNGVCVHDGAHDLLIRRHGDIDHVFSHHGGPVLIAERMPELHC